MAPLDRAEFHAQLAYAVGSLGHAAARLHGPVPPHHSMRRALERVQRSMARVSEARANQSADRPRIDTVAASRMVQAATGRDLASVGPQTTAEQQQQSDPSDDSDAASSSSSSSASGSDTDDDDDDDDDHQAPSRASHTSRNKSSGPLRDHASNKRPRSSDSARKRGDRSHPARPAKRPSRTGSNALAPIGSAAAAIDGSGARPAVAAPGAARFKAASGGAAARVLGSKSTPQPIAGHLNWRERVTTLFDSKPNH